MPETIRSDHARHDTTLIARHAAGDLSDTDRATADALIATCDTCVALRRDLVAITAATRSLPAPMTANRDFRLDPAQAERLQRGSWLRNILRPFGASRSGVRPMAAAFTSLGVAGLFVAMVLPGVLMSGAAPGAAPRELQAQAAPSNAAAAPGATSAAGGAVDGLSPVSHPSFDSGYLGAEGGTGNQSTDKTTDGATQVPVVAAVGGDPTPAAPVADSGAQDRLSDVRASNPLMIASLGLLGLGVLLFGLRFAARRLR